MSLLPEATRYCTLTPFLHQWRERTNIKFRKQTNYFAGYICRRASLSRELRPDPLLNAEIDFYANMSPSIAAPFFDGTGWSKPHAIRQK